MISQLQVGINYQTPVVVPQGDLPQTDRSLTILSNNTSIRHAWNRIAYKFDTMYKRRAFVHHYLAEGMEESVFKEARDDLTALMEDYNEIENWILSILYLEKLQPINITHDNKKYLNRKSNIFHIALEFDKKFTISNL